jgi:hypothetical protein
METLFFHQIAVNQPRCDALATEPNRDEWREIGA